MARSAGAALLLNAGASAGHAAAAAAAAANNAALISSVFSSSLVHARSRLSATVAEAVLACKAERPTRMAADIARDADGDVLGLGLGLGLGGRGGGGGGGGEGRERGGLGRLQSFGDREGAGWMGSSLRQHQSLPALGRSLVSSALVLGSSVPARYV